MRSAIRQNAQCSDDLRDGRQRYPVFRVHLDRNTWAGVNWFTVGAIAVATGVFLRNKK